ncbi:MAG: hypothetical protein QMD77_00955 [Patescibacteria group bacterium]|nr:hypothetical protein [Patescibacteria group bacterium]
MTLIANEQEQLCGGWLDSLWLPSRKQTETARQELLQSFDKEYIFAANPPAQAFAEGKLTIGQMIVVDGRQLILKGVYPKMEYPEAMVFWDHPKGRYVQFIGAPFVASNIVGLAGV